MWYKDIYLSEYSYTQKKILFIFTENRFCSNVIYLDYNFPSLYSLQFFIPYIFTTPEDRGAGVRRRDVNEIRGWEDG